MPLSQPTRGRDGREITEVIVPRGTFVQMHYWASNNDKAIWGEDALEFRPSRWFSPTVTSSNSGISTSTNPTTQYLSPPTPTSTGGPKPTNNNTTNGAASLAVPSISFALAGALAVFAFGL